MAMFDKDKDGTVNCAEFLLQFFLVGFQVRDRDWRLRGLRGVGEELHAEPHALLHKRR